MKARENLDYIIVLGAHVDGTRMTLAFWKDQKGFALS